MQVTPASLIHSARLPALAASLSATLSGCALPYLDTAHAAYRVDPVLVQWGSRVPATGQGNGPDEVNLCPRVSEKEEGARSARTPVDVMCPLDLDTYVFPQDLKARSSAAGPRLTAYERVLSCQEIVAPSEFGTSLGHALDIARTKQSELQQRANRLPASLATERNVHTTRQKAQADADTALSTAQTNLKAAASSAASAPPEERERQEEALSSARTSLAGAEKQKEAADSELAAQSRRVQALEAEGARLPELQRQVAAEIKRLEDEIRKFGAGGLAPGGTASLVERQQEANCMTLRNQLQEEIVSRSVQMCEKHLSDTEATASLFNATFGFGALTQSALAAVVTGKVWAQALSTGAAITTGTQAVINKEVYRNAVVPAIKRAIKGERERRLNLMRANQLRPLLEYPAGRAVSEAAAFHEACSFSTGLELIGNDAEKRVEHSVPEIESRVKALADQIKTVDGSISTSSTDAEKRSAERSKLRLRQEIEILQSRLGSARQGGAN